MRIGLTGSFVDDQDKVERFYTEVLGFKVKTSAAYGPAERRPGRPLADREHPRCRRRPPPRSSWLGWKRPGGH
jgi:catechol-2,3-dioxygenase